MQSKLAKLLAVAVLTLGLTGSAALAKGGPPPGHDNNGNGAGDHGKPDDPGGNGQGSTKPADKPPDKPPGKPPDKPTGPPPKAQANKAAAQAKQEAKFQKQTKKLGYTCRPGTTHLEGVVTVVVHATATTPGFLTITVTKGNSRGKSKVGQKVTITLLTSTEVIRTGHTTQSALVIGAKLKLDLRACTDRTPGASEGLVARRIVSNK
jgi:hypothetical protein